MQSVESTAEELTRASDATVWLLREVVARYSQASERADVLEDDNVRLVEDVSAIAAEIKALKNQLDSAKVDLTAAKGEVRHLKKEITAVQAREDDLASSQGEVVRALAQRIFRLGKFDTLVADLNDVMTTRKLAETLDKVAEDYPDLDKEKYEYKVILDAQGLRTNVEVLLEHTSAFPVVEALAKRRTLLSATKVSDCAYDRDEEFEELLADVAEKIKEEAARKAREG